MEELMNRMHHHSIFIKQLKYGLELKKKKKLLMLSLYSKLSIFESLICSNQALP
jgi:hypothetical protein